ncbi:hypothetical protein MNBD_NITROSPIRAE01-840 [hydrothermal vent metagenome]|uniref:Glycosyl transferase family 1 domain-containing protein n=1 Tax=hydrothermal vent metagenome TaxID=652676 RepID=A0A3B1DE32_9ZZZZ
MHPSDRSRIPSEAERLQGKKILSIYFRHKPGGLCKRLYMMFDALVSAGAEVHYIAVEPYPISSHIRIVPHLLWTPFKKKEGLLFWLYFVSIAPFYLFVVGRRENIDLVSVFGGIYGFFAVFLKVLLQKPIMIFVRADAYEIGQILGRPSFLLFFEEIMSRISFKLSDKIVTVNHHLKKMISTRYRVREDKIEVLFNHIQDLSEEGQIKSKYRKKLKLEGNSFIIITVAILDSRKNIDFLIRVASHLKEPALFLIVGDGSEKNTLKKIAAAVKGNAKIIFTGWQEDVSDFLKASDLFVLPSKHEGCSNALLEALSYGIPCLGSNIPENREVLRFDQLMFDPIDIQTFSDKLGRVILDQDFSKQVRAFSNQAAKQLIFDWDRSIADLHYRLLFL